MNLIDVRLIDLLLEFIWMINTNTYVINMF